MFRCVLIIPYSWSRHCVIYIPLIVLLHYIDADIFWHRIPLTHCGRVTHICVGNVTTIGADNGLALTRRQAILWTNSGILLIGPLGTNVSEILIEIHAFKKIRLKLSSAKWQPFCLGLNVLTYICLSRLALCPKSIWYMSVVIGYYIAPCREICRCDSRN